MRISIAISLSILLSILVACKGHSGHRDSQGADSRDTLHVATISGPLSYFTYKGELLGFDYENIKVFAEDLDMELEITTAPNMAELLKMVENGKADVAAYPIPIIAEYNNRVRHCGPLEITSQVLIQPEKDKIEDVTGLIGRKVVVEEDSKYFYRLQNLNEELGGGILIETIHADSIIPENLIEMVECGKIPMTIVDSDVAAANMPYFPDLNADLKISLDQYSSWAVALDNEVLASKIDTWEKKVTGTDLAKKIYRKYFEEGKSVSENADSIMSYKYLNLKKGAPISPYDEYFRKFAPIAGIDWTILASIGYNESRFNKDVISRFGAAGIMQIMPSTARAQGVNPDLIMNPADNILAAAKLIKNLDNALAGKVEDPEERLKFVVAAYNSGLGHIYDSMALAEKYGLNPSRWTGNVGEAVLMKSNPKYYTDPVVKNGYFRGRETIDFVEKVMFTANHFKEFQN